MGIDFLFYPEKIAAEEVISLLGHTSTTEFVDFSGGRLSLVVFRLEPTSVLVGRELSGFAPDESAVYRTVAIMRDGKTIIPHGSDTYMVGDMVYIIARHDSVSEVMALSGQGDVHIKNMMILGGSRIGVQIAQAMQDQGSRVSLMTNLSLSTSEMTTLSGYGTQSRHGKSRKASMESSGFTAMCLISEERYFLQETLQCMQQVLLRLSILLIARIL